MLTPLAPRPTASHAMHPYIFSFDLPFRDSPFHLRAFGVMVALGFLVGAHLYQRLAARYGDDPENDPLHYSRITLWILIGCFGGARVMYVLVEVLRESTTGESYLEHPLSMLFFWEGGLVMYGGWVGAVVLGSWIARRVGVRPLHALDLGVTAGFVGQAIGRVGCLLVGDDYGSRVPEKLGELPFPLAIRTPDPLPDGSLFGDANAGQLLWATQIWMSLNALLIAYVSWRILRRRRYTGQVALWVILIYSVTRFGIEAFRGDEVRGLWFGGALSTSQLISVVAALVTITLLILTRHRRDPLPDALANGAPTAGGQTSAS